MNHHGSNKIRYDLIQLAKRLNKAQPTTKDNQPVKRPMTPSQQEYHKVGFNKPAR